MYFRSLIFAVFIFCIPIFAVAQCPVTTSSNGLSMLSGNATDILPGDVVLKTNAITIGGLNYDAVFKILSVNVPTGALIIDAANANNFSLGSVQPDENPFVTYNLSFVQSGTATVSNPAGTPVNIVNFKLELPDIDGAAASLPTTQTNRNYCDISGQITSGGPSATVTLGNEVIANNFFDGGPSGFTTFRNPAVPSLSVPVAIADYWVTYDYPLFPKTGATFVFGTTRDQSKNTGTASVIANRLFFHNFTIGCFTTLPVKWISFTTASKGKGVLLNWKTAEETSVAFFIPEYSIDGQIFHEIGKIIPSSAASYQFFHQQAASGINYYRIKEVSQYGSFSYSAIRTVNNAALKTVSVFPNPSKNYFNVTTTSGNIISIKINNANGALMKIILPSGITTSYSIDMTNALPGIYFAEMELSNGKIETKKITVIR